MNSFERNDGSPAAKSSARPVTVGIMPENYAFLQRYIHEESGIMLDEDKRYLVESRLMPIVLDEKIESLNALGTC